MSTKSVRARSGATRRHFSVLVYPEDELWLAHCLELDLVAQADDPDRAIEGVLNAIDAVLLDAASESVPLSRLLRERRAPQELWDRYAATEWTTSTRRSRPRRAQARSLAVNAKLEPVGA